MKLHQFLCLGVAIVAPTVLFGNLITNPGFELGVSTVPADWTVQPAVDDTDPWARNTTNFHSGAYSIANGCEVVDGVPDCLGSSYFEQNVATLNGESYTLLFWADADRDLAGQPLTPNGLAVYWGGGAPVLTLADIGAGGWQQYEVAGLVATSNQMGLRFGGRDDPARIYVDDIQVIADALPEPGALILLGSGLLALAGIRRLRHAAS